jgi:tetratricopeptide (TPR) repeat protein
VPGAPSAPPHHSFALGPAAAALVTQAHAQAAHDPQLAIDTLERALRIEPGNPLLWIELGEVHQGAGRYALADSMGRKALQLASGDSGAQARAWRLIAESLRARNRNAEAGDAQARSDALLAR